MEKMMIKRSLSGNKIHYKRATPLSATLLAMLFSFLCFIEWVVHLIICCCSPRAEQVCLAIFGGFLETFRASLPRSPGVYDPFNSFKVMDFRRVRLHRI